MEFKSMICEICGGTEFAEKNGLLVCIHCDANYQKQIKEETDEEKEARILRVSRFDDAEKELRMSPPHFDYAEDKFSELIKQYPTWSVGYWGVVRAKYGIKYEIDLDGKTIPSCYKSSYEDFRNDIYYKKALEYAETKDLKAKYKAEGDRIARTCKEWREKAKQFDYDIFISFKASENGEETRDAREMQNLYTFLTEKGYKVFFSPVSMRSIVGRADWDAYIFNALEKARVMILYGSNVDYFTTTWIENEWTRYLRMIGKGMKNPNSLIVAYENFDANSLPRQLRKLQAINAEDKTFYPTLLERIADIFAKDVVRPAAIERREVKGGAVGKKATQIEDYVQTIEAGSTQIARKTHLDTIAIEKRNIASDAKGYVPSVSDTVQTAVACLQQSAFDNAEMFFDDCINENKTNGAAWLGLLCTKLENPDLYDEIVNSRTLTFTFAENDEQELGGLIEELQNAIEYAADRQIAENILSYVLYAIRIITCKPEINNGLPALFNLLIKYESSIYNEAVDYMANCIPAIASICPSGYNQICQDVLARISNVDRYIEVVENIIGGYISKSNVLNAKEWNEKLLEVDESNLNANLRAIYMLVDSFDESSFKQRQLNVYVATAVVPYLEKVVHRVSKTDAEKVLNFACETELYCLENLKISNAEAYFDFAVKYSFPERERFLEKQKGYTDLLATHSAESFFEKYLRTMSHERVDWHISQRIRFADKLRETNQASMAQKMYNSVFTLEEDNYNALNGLFAISIGLFGKPYNNIKWTDFNVEAFEKILAHCPSSKLQLKVVQQYLDACVASIDSQKYSDFAPQSNVFDQLLKYFPASESKKMYGYVDDISDSFLQEGEYDLALKYANLSLQNEPTYNIKARYNILLATLKCSKLTDFVKCEQFDKNMPEYKMLLLACKGNDEALQKYIEMAKKNEKFVSDAKRRQAEEERKAQEKKQREEREAAEKKAREAREARERAEKLRADKVIIMEKYQHIHTRAIICLLVPVAMILLAIIGSGNLDWDYFDEAVFAPIILIILLIGIGIANWVCSAKYFNKSSELRASTSLADGELNNLDKIIGNSKIMTIVSSVSLGLEFSLFYIPFIVMGVAMLACLALIILLVGFLLFVFNGGRS